MMSVKTLNIYEIINLKFKGFMIPNYLSNNFSSMKYVEMIKPDDKKYNPFNLVFYEKNQ